MPRKALVNTKRNALMPPGHPIIIQYGRRIGKKVYSYEKYKMAN